MTTWKKLIEQEFDGNGESWEDVESNTLSVEEITKEFSDGFGGTEGTPFTLWTKKRVYFPVQYDGSEWVGSVSRNPDGIATDHIGGG
jgi:hypothetical protein